MSQVTQAKVSKEDILFGVPHEPCECALAMSLLDNTGDTWQVGGLFSTTCRYEGHNSDWLIGGIPFDLEPEYYTLSAGIWKFLVEFDNIGERATPIDYVIDKDKPPYHGYAFGIGGYRNCWFGYQKESGYEAVRSQSE